MVTYSLDYYYCRRRRRRRRHSKEDMRTIRGFNRTPPGLGNSEKKKTRKMSIMHRRLCLIVLLSFPIIKFIHDAFLSWLFDPRVSPLFIEAENKARNMHLLVFISM
jgi:hypothetical protein